MSLPQPVPDTEAQQIIALLTEVRARQDEQAAAINQIAQTVNWLVENVKDIFAFFGSSQMMQLMSSMPMPGMPPGMMPPIPANLTGAQSSEPDTTGGNGDNATGGPAVPADAAGAAG